jgi:hypothetical protein
MLVLIAGDSTLRHQGVGWLAELQVYGGNSLVCQEKDFCGTVGQAFLPVHVRL